MADSIRTVQGTLAEVVEKIDWATAERAQDRFDAQGDWKPDVPKGRVFTGDSVTYATIFHTPHLLFPPQGLLPPYSAEAFASFEKDGTYRLPDKIAALVLDSPETVKVNLNALDLSYSGGPALFSVSPYDSRLSAETRKVGEEVFPHWEEAMKGRAERREGSFVFSVMPPADVLKLTANGGVISTVGQVQRDSASFAPDPIAYGQTGYARGVPLKGQSSPLR